MSLETAGVWQVGVWATTVWADGVWREGEYVSSGLVGREMFATYVNTKMTPESQEIIMMPEFKKREMIV